MRTVWNSPFIMLRSEAVRISKSVRAPQALSADPERQGSEVRLTRIVG